MSTNMTTVEVCELKVKDDFDASSEDQSKIRSTNSPKTSNQLSAKQRILTKGEARASSNMDGITWNEFTKNTTFHGIKYIFDASPTAYRTRRVMWVVCVIAAVLFFVVQVSLRVGVFLEYNTNVDVEKIYTTTLPFPAVTICNQNNFRLTVTAQKGLYYYIDAVFGGTDNGTLKDLAHYTNEEIGTVDFLMDTAHQLEDLMDSCTWKGKRCNMTTDWFIRQTDMGLCFTFNNGHNGQPAAEVTESGAGLGLSLILNVEQYEYMMGPQNDAGIKILLHDQSEFPMIKDLGFAVAPSTHALVGINRFVIKSMEYPYGLCDKQRNESMSDCRIACYAQEVASRCHCRDAYMGNESDVPVCNIDQTFGCVKDVLEQLQMEESNCSCTVPCTRTNYEPALSYAQLSKFSIDRLVLTDPRRRLAVKKQYELATEVLQRTGKEIVSRDTALISDIQSKMQALVDIIDTAMVNLTSSQVDIWIDDMTAALRTDHGFLVEQVEDVVWPKIRNIKKEFTQYTQCIHDTLSFVEGFQVSLPARNEVEKHLTDCLAIDCHPNSGGGGGRRPPPRPPAPLVEKLARIPDSCMELVDALDSVLWLPNEYMTSIEGLFAETSSDPSVIPDHLTCLLNLHKIKDDIFVNATHELVDTMRFLFADPSQRGLVDVATQLLGLVFNTSASTLGTLHSIAASTCTWPMNHFPFNGRRALADIDKAIPSLETLKTVYASFQGDVSDVNDILTYYLVTATEAVNDYQSGSITKLEMASVMHSHLVTTGIENLLDSEMALTRISRKMNEILQDIRRQLQTNFEYLFDLDIPLLNSERIDKLSLITFAKSMKVEEIEVLYQNLSQDYPKNVDDIIELVTENLGVPMRTMKETIVKYTTAAGNALTDYSEELDDYEQQSKIQQEFFMQNFLQVDIFYRELNSEHIVQRPSFAASSLLGEVGGFLGLLLGASILTMCELFDYIVMSCMVIFQKKKKTAPMKSS